MARKNLTRKVEIKAFGRVIAKISIKPNQDYWSAIENTARNNGLHLYEVEVNPLTGEGSLPAYLSRR